jgi:hypothetical protein
MCALAVMEGDVEDREALQAVFPSLSTIESAGDAPARFSISLPLQQEGTNTELAQIYACTELQLTPGTALRCAHTQLPTPAAAAAPLLTCVHILPAGQRNARCSMPRVWVHDSSFWRSC